MCQHDGKHSLTPVAHQGRLKDIILVLVVGAARNPGHFGSGGDVGSGSVFYKPACIDYFFKIIRQYAFMDDQIVFKHEKRLLSPVVFPGTIRWFRCA